MGSLCSLDLVHIFIMLLPLKTIRGVYLHDETTIANKPRKSDWNARSPIWIQMKWTNPIMIAILTTMRICGSDIRNPDGVVEAFTFVRIVRFGYSPGAW